jgi:hypothetical protein
MIMGMRFLWAWLPFSSELAEFWEGKCQGMCRFAVVALYANSTVIYTGKALDTR